MTISKFYQENLINKLYLCISPIILGEGISSFILPEKQSLSEIKQHEITYSIMGTDILCDINLI